MKAIPFERNDLNFSVEYIRTREGPNWFRCYYKNACMGIIDPLDAWRTLGVAKFTDTGKLLKEWCIEMHEAYGPKDYTEEEVKTEFFDHTPEPNDETKMIT